MKLSKIEISVLKEIRCAGVSHEVIDIDCSRGWPADRSAVWKPVMHCPSKNTLFSLQRKGFIKNLRTFWKGASCEVTDDSPSIDNYFDD